MAARLRVFCHLLLSVKIDLTVVWMYLAGLIFMALSLGHADAAKLWPLPDQVASSHFTVTINGHTTPVMHAAANNYFLNFEAGRKVKVAVTADRDDFWAQGVEIEPWRLNIRPVKEGRTIRFVLDGPVKISIGRPDDFLGNADLLFLFANPKETDTRTAAAPGVRYFGPGVHTENIDAASGDMIYLAPGAVVFGALNLWGVEHVRVLGRGVIVYDGPQNPDDDEGWMHKRNWHCIVMDNARDISIEGITCVTRSRTWQIQMKDSRDVHFTNVKVIGANRRNANADGMDWLGGGETTVKDSFFRAADDIFSMEGSWEGYGPAAFAVEGHPVTNISVEDSVLSTSISNVVRAGWPQKRFEGGGFTMKNSDVLHAGIGGCGIPFALMEIWADPNGRGRSGNFNFENIRLEHWYSFTQLMEPVDGITGVRFQDVFGIEEPAKVPSELRGSVHDVSFDNVGSSGAPLEQGAAAAEFVTTQGADAPLFAETGPRAEIRIDAGLVRPGHKMKFEAVAPNSTGLKYEWTFGDGDHAGGRKVKHRFRDTEGTLLDGSGRFRVLLHVMDQTNRNSWIYEPVVVAKALMPAVTPASAPVAGLTYEASRLESAQAAEPAASSEAAAPASGTTPLFSSAVRTQPQDYMLTFAGLVDVPADGGYTFTLFANDAGTIRIDGHLIAELPAPFAQVCGLAGNAVRSAIGSMALAKGLHRIEVSESHSTGADGFRVFWQGPGTPLGELPSTRLLHSQVAVDSPTMAPLP